jgi:fibronectin-binding autotransporter adhesin
MPPSYFSHQSSFSVGVNLPAAARGLSKSRRLKHGLSCLHLLPLFFQIACLATFSECVVASDWTGANGEWSDNGDPGWNGTGVPNAVGAIANFGSTANLSGTTTQDVVGGVTVGTISVSADVSAVRMITNTTGITLNQDGTGAAVATISNSNQFNGSNNSLQIGGAGALTLADDLLISNTSDSTSNNAIKISCRIGGTGNLTLSNVKNSVAAINLSVDSTFAGAVSIAKGLVTYSTSAALGNSANAVTLGSVDGGSATFLSTTSTSNFANNITTASGSGGTLTIGSSGAANSNGATYSGTLTLNDSARLVASAGGNVVKFTNTISGTGGITKDNNGTVQLSGMNTYAGVTQINGGTLLINGNQSGATGAVSVNNSGTLGGIGTVGGAVTVSMGATINPGQSGPPGSAAVVGTLHTGALTLQSGSFSIFDVSGTTNYDRIISGGTLTLGGTLDLNIASGVTFTSGQTLTLLSGTSQTGTFSNIVDDMTYTFDGYEFVANYTGSGFTLTPVPEPSTWAAAALALIAVGWTQRSRFRRSPSVNIG